MLVVMNIFQAIGFLASETGCPPCCPAAGHRSRTVCYTPFHHAGFYSRRAYLQPLCRSNGAKWQIVLSCLTTVIFGSLFAFQSNPAAAYCLRLFYYHWSNARLTYSYQSYQSGDFPHPNRRERSAFCYSFSRLSTVFSSIIIGLILQYSMAQRRSLPLLLDQYAELLCSPLVFLVPTRAVSTRKYLITVTNKMPSHNL